MEKEELSIQDIKTLISLVDWVKYREDALGDIVNFDSLGEIDLEELEEKLITLGDNKIAEERIYLDNYKDFSMAVQNCPQFANKVIHDTTNLLKDSLEDVWTRVEWLMPSVTICDKDHDFTFAVKNGETNYYTVFFNEATRYDESYPFISNENKMRLDAISNYLKVFDNEDVDDSNAMKEVAGELCDDILDELKDSIVSLTELENVCKYVFNKAYYENHLTYKDCYFDKSTGQVVYDETVISE